MRLNGALLALCSLFCFYSAKAQVDTVTIKIRVLDSYTKAAMGGVSVIDPKSNAVHGTDADGTCTFTALNTDTFFLFAPGYRTVKVSTADSAFKREYNITYLFEPLNTGLNQAVIIKAPKTLEDIEKERQNLGITPKELERPKISFTSPISALYELLSGKAKEREKLKQQMVEDERRKIFRELLAYYNENGLIDLPESYYDDFIDYCNLPLNYLKYNSDYEITKTIIDFYNHYARMNGLIK